MRSTLYRSGEFEIDPFVRELRHLGVAVELPGSAFDCLVYLVEHRNRPVGRDELIAAVWARADVSEMLLGHAIVRLRRVLGDSGNDQHSIRTMPRVGYRWIAATTEVHVDRTAGAVSADASARQDAALPLPPVAVIASEPSKDSTTPSRSTSRAMRIALAASMLLLMAIVVAWSFHRSSPVVVDTPAAVPTLSGLVLPATVKAPADWSWLRLGLMDLVASRLQRASIAMLRSDTVVGLLGGTQGDASALLSDAQMAKLATLRVLPTVEFSRGDWHVRLDAFDGERRLQVDARDADALVAARTATDLLLAKLGHAPPADEEQASPAMDQLQQQVKAATLAGQLDLARALVREAPRALRDSPDLEWSRALIDATAGDYETARRDLDALLERVSGERNPVLRARALTMRAAMYTRRGKNALAGADYAEAITLVENRREPLVLAHAYAGRGLVAATTGRYDDAIADLGRARIISESANGALATAQIDLNLGLIAKDRGQLGAALPVLVHAADRFEALASQEEWAVAVEAIAGIQLANLDFDAARASTDRFWPPEQHVGNVRLQWSLTLTRASVLVATGQLDAATLLATQVETRASAPDDIAVKAGARAVLAAIDFARGDPTRAAITVAAALVPELESTDPTSYREARMLYVRSLEASGQGAAAGRERQQLRAWLLTRRDGQAAVDAALLDADQSRAERRTEAALKEYAMAWDAAGRLGIPDVLVTCARPYVDLLIDAGRLEDASAVAGRIAAWDDRDFRVALTEARLYKALGQTEAWQKAIERALRLAGQRPVSSHPGAPDPA